MTNDEWNECNDALEMLIELKEALSAKAYASIKPTLHGYLLACCGKISHLLPQEVIQLGLDAARRHLEGDLDRNVLHWLDWYVEAACFALDYRGDNEEVREMVSKVEELKGLPYEEAVERLKNAAYFADSAMLGMVPDKKSKTDGQFLCTALLKKFLPAPFDRESLAKATPRPLMTNMEWSKCSDILMMFDNLRRLPIAKYKSLQLRSTVHRFLLASCDKYMHLLQSPMIQQGLIGANEHLEEPIGHRKLYALWGNAFDEVGEHDSEGETEETNTRHQAQQLALAAINGQWPRNWSKGAELYSPELLRKFLPSPFDH